MFKEAVLLDNMSALSLSVALIVIVCMTAAFSILLAVYSSNKRKLINSGGEDDSIRAELEKGYEKYKKSGKGDGSVRSYNLAREKRATVGNVIVNIVFGIVMAAVLALAVTGIVYKINNRQLFIGKTAYLTIQTGSMADKNPDNEYYTFLPDNQIPQFSLIGIDKVREDQLKLYDIVAFEHNGVTYVHRIVGIGQGVNGKLFTTLGDNNVGSMPFEINMSFDKIVGVYNGYHNVGLGALLSYLQSETGLIALAFALILVLVADIADSGMIKTYKKRYAYVADLIEHPEKEETPAAEEKAEEPAPVAEEPPKAEEPAPQAAEVAPAESVQPAEQPVEPAGQPVEPAEQPVEAVATEQAEAQPEPQAEEPSEEEDEEGAVVYEKTDLGFLAVREKSGFIARLVEGSEENRAAYLEIKREIMSYKGVKSRLGWKGENFKYAKKLVMSMKIRGKTLCLYLAVDPAKYAEGKIRVDDLGEKGGTLPSLYKINGKRKTGYAKEIIAAMMAELGATRVEIEEENYLAEYENLTHEELIERGLIRQVKDSSFDTLKSKKAIVVNEEPAAEIAEEVTAEEPAEEIAVTEAEETVEEETVSDARTENKTEDGDGQ